MKRNLRSQQQEKMKKEIGDDDALNVNNIELERNTKGEYTIVSVYRCF